MKKLVVVICIMFVVILMVMTNPNKSDYVNWIQESSIAQTNNSLGKGLIALIGNPVFNSSTLSKNFVLFSIYKTSVIGDTGTTSVLAVANNFIPFTEKSRYVIFTFYILMLVLASTAVLYIFLPYNCNKIKYKD